MFKTLELQPCLVYVLTSTTLNEILEAHSSENMDKPLAYILGSYVCQIATLSTRILSNSLRSELEIYERAVA